MKNHLHTTVISALGCTFLYNPIIQKEKSISYYIRKYFKKVTNYQELIPSEFQPGKLYGIAKVYKTNVPLRPVVSMVGTPEYKLAKCLDSLIKSHIPDTYVLRSTENFIERLKKCPCNNKNTMVSLEVVSLFTNVPLAEMIESVIERLYDNNNSNAIPFEKKCISSVNVYGNARTFYVQ